MSGAQSMIRKFFRFPFDSVPRVEHSLILVLNPFIPQEFQSPIVAGG